MVLKLSLFYLSVVFVFLLTDYQSSSFSKSRQIKLSYGNAFQRAIFWGNKNQIKKETMKIFKDLNLVHIFTPSGLHFTVLRKFLFLFSALPFFNFILFFLFRFYSSFHSIQRITLIYLFKSYFSLESSFFITFILEFICGNWHTSPLSFAYSYLFLGSIVLTVKCRKSIIISTLIISIIVSKNLMSEMLYPLSLCFNFPLTALFSLMLPLFVFGIGINFYTELCKLAWKSMSLVDPIIIQDKYLIMVLVIYFLGIKKAENKSRLFQKNNDSSIL